MPLPTRTSRRLIAAALAASGVLAMTACGSPSADSAASSTSSTVSSASAASSPTTSSSTSAASWSDGSAAASSTAALTVTDPWVKATDGTMTAAFGTLTNDGDEPVHLVGVRTDLTDHAELHEMVSGADGQTTMRRVEGGVTVPAHGTVELKPGGEHVMLMDLTAPVQAGEEVTYLLELEDGSTVEVTSTARPFAGANESYHGGEASGSMKSGHADH